MQHNHSHTSHGSGEKNIKTAFILNFVFTIIEIIGGLYTNSLAILSDALHDLGDSFSLGLSWYLSKVSSRKRTPAFSYGYKRFSLLAAAINGAVLLAGSLIILSQAVPRLFSPEHSNAQGMFFLALIGVAVNGVAAWRLRSGKTMNERMVSWHLFEDVFGWVAVLFISAVMLIKDIHILDPLLSILFTLYILWNVVKNLKKTVMIFLQSAPESLEAEEIEKEILKNLRIKGIHDTHIWSLDGESHIFTTHIIVGRNTSQGEAANIKYKTKKIVEKMGIHHATIEIETEGEECDLGCD